MVASSRVRISGCSSDSGLARRTVRADLGVDVEPQRGVAVGADERRAPHLGQALPGEHVGDEAPNPLCVGEPGTAREGSG